MEQQAIGIDLGTSTSEISVFQHGEAILIPDPGTKSPIIPSLVAINKRGQVYIGEDARSFVDISGHGVREVKRKMGTAERIHLLDKEYRPEDISAIILQKLKTNAETYLGTSVKEVVLSVPANFPDAARLATLNAAEIAGLNVLRLINEPTAAAMAFGVQNVDLEAQIVVFDFGGGTLDISVLEMMEGLLDVRCSFGDHQLGGKDFDDVMTSLILSKVSEECGALRDLDKARVILKSTAEKFKIALSTNESFSMIVGPFTTSDGRSTDADIEIFRDELERASAPLLDRARQCVIQALNAGKIRPSAVDKVLLVGGTTYIPCVRQLVAELFGKDPATDVNPDLAVAMGASIVAANELGIIDPSKGLILTDVAPYGLGVDVVSEVSGRLMLIYEPLIQPNMPIPYTCHREYSLLHADQRSVEIRILQDHTGKARFPEEAVDTGISGCITDIPPALYGSPHPLLVDFTYDRNGLAKIKASIPGIGKSIEILYDHNAARMNQEDIEASKYNLRSLLGALPSPESEDTRWKSHKDAKRYEALISKAERLIAEMPTEKPRLMSAIDDIKRALSMGDDEEIKLAGNNLTDTLFEIESGL